MDGRSRRIGGSTGIAPWPLLGILLVSGITSGCSERPREAASTADDQLDPVEGESVIDDSSTSETILSSQEVCGQLGYLCDEIAQTGEYRAVRWSDDTETLHILVTAPDHEPPERARALQQAAILGVRSWQRQPLGLRVDAMPRRDDYDIVVTWAPTLAGRSLGRTDTRWTVVDGRADFTVEGLVLATSVSGRPLEVGAIRLTAAHEMGHALGLPHSGSPGDLMYPENTSTRLTSRDYRSVKALYTLENGTIIRP